MKLKKLSRNVDPVEHKVKVMGTKVLQNGHVRNNVKEVCGTTFCIGF